MILRDYQQDALESLKEGLQSKASVLCVMPTGSGKTEVMMSLLKGLRGSTLVLLNKLQLIEQTERRFKQAGLMPSVFCASLNRKEVSALTVASVHSWHLMSEKHFDYLILDEVHNVDETQEESRYFKCIKEQNASKLIGFTATPFRAQGNIYGRGKLFPEITFRLELMELISRGFLVPPIMKATHQSFDTEALAIRGGDWSQDSLNELSEDHEKTTKQVAEAKIRLAGRKKVFWQCINIKHAEFVASEIRRIFNEEAIAVHSYENYIERNRRLLSFTSGPVKHCVFVSILSEGFDYPQADALVLLRPIRSPVLYVQTVGRVLRPSPSSGKIDALVLDFGKVRETCGPLDKPVVREKNQKTTVMTEFWTCECLTYNELFNLECASCGKPRPRLQRGPVTKNLTFQSAEEDLFVNKLIRLKCKSVIAARHLARSQNECLKLSFVLDDPSSAFGAKIVHEFFVMGHKGLRYKATRMCFQLGESYDSLCEQVRREQKVFVRTLPDEVEFSREGNFERITRLIFKDRERRREGDLKLLS